jgi:hypothetical protein
MGYMIKWIDPESGPAEKFVCTGVDLAHALESLGVSGAAMSALGGLAVANDQPVYWTRVPLAWVRMAAAIDQFEEFSNEPVEDSFSRGQRSAFRQCTNRFRAIFDEIRSGK